MDLWINEFMFDRKIESRFDWKPDHYSVDIAAAWEVVEKFDNFNILKSTWGSGEVEWLGAIVIFPEKQDTYSVDAIADTAPLAICRAALLAMLYGR